MIRSTTSCALTASLISFAVANPVLMDTPVTPKEHQRAPEQTFLTIPEWFLVHSPAEYASFIKEKPPSEFPYFGHIGQFWENYGAVYDATKDAYPFNSGYHVMVMVIGTSTTVEYALKSAYETLIGRLSELSRTHGKTEEDVFAASVAQDYVDFIRVLPWYEYEFVEKLKELWTKTSLWGPDLFRKWERKYALTSEYGAKAIYGWIIKKLTELSYEAPLPVTAILVDRLPPTAMGQLPGLKVLKHLPDQSILITVPRYDAFKHYVSSLAKKGVRFLEIAGNRSVILLSVLAPAEWKPKASSYEVLVTQPILTQPTTKRIVMIVPVHSLGNALNEFDKPPFRIEHVYDY